MNVVRAVDSVANSPECQGAEGRFDLQAQCACRQRHRYYSARLPLKGESV